MTSSQADGSQWAVPCLVPDLPSVEELLPYLREIQGNRWYTNFGPLAGRYEAELACFAGTSGTGVCAVTFSSATLALSLTLRAMELRPGARVLLPALTFPASALAVMDAGLTPVFTDVDAKTWDLDPHAVATVSAVTRIDAVMPVTPFGYPVSLASWTRFHAKTAIPVLLDAAGALGTQCTDGAIPVVYSLHATKPLGVGEGGVLVTRDKFLAVRARRLSNFGFQEGTVRHRGTNAKLSEFHAAVGLAQLARSKRILERRRAVLDRYRSLLPASLFKRSTENGEAEQAIPAVLPLHTAGRATEVIECMTRGRIQTRRWYFPPLHEHPAFAGVERVAGRGRAALEVTDFLARSLVGIPFHNFLDDSAVQLVAEAVLDTVC